MVERVKLHPAIAVCKYLYIAERFRAKHPTLLGILDGIAQRPESSWQIFDDVDAFLRAVHGSQAGRANGSGLKSTRESPIDLPASAKEQDLAAFEKSILQARCRAHGRLHQLAATANAGTANAQQYTTVHLHDCVAERRLYVRLTEPKLETRPILALPSPSAREFWEEPLGASGSPA